MTAWTEEDIRVASVLEAGLGPVRVVEVIKHEENRMTDVASPDMPIPSEEWGQDPEQEMAYATGQKAVTYPEVVGNPHNHTYTWSPKLPDGSMLVVRSQTPQGLVEAVEAMAPAAARLHMAWLAVTGTPPAPQAPAQAVPAAMQSQPNYNPQMPPPNQPFPGQPAWQQAGAPQAQAAPQWGGGGAQQGGGQGNKPQPKQCPPGWFRTDKNSGPGADFWKNWREQNQGSLKGKISWGGASTFWVAPDVAAMVNAAGFIVVAA